MKRTPFIKMTLIGVLYIILGNVMCLFMTMAISMFGSNFFLNAVSILCSSAVFFSLIFTCAWKDGVKERGLVKLGRVESEQKHRWIPIGIILFFVSAAPTIVLLLNKLLFPEEDTFLMYRFVSGSAFPFILAFVPPVITETEAWVQTSLRQIDNMSVLFPALMLVFYALVPVAAQLGYWCGLNDKLSKDKIMYK